MSPQAHTLSSIIIRLAWIIPLASGCALLPGEARADLPPTPRIDATEPPRLSVADGQQLVAPPTPTPYPDDEYISIGRSLEGRDLLAWQFGDGPVTLALVGGIHGGYEFNSVVLVEQLAETVRNDPSSILPGIRLVMVPSANPDGVARGRGPEGRFNANGVDLNRNWGCGWLPTSYWQDQTISPGPRPFSEPETVALRAYLLAMQPAAVVFYHSAGEAIFAGGCGDESAASQHLGDLLSIWTAYPNEVTFEYYEVSGTADDWLDERGIPAVTVELTDRSEPELARNLAGLMGLQCFFALNGNAAPGPLIRAEVERRCAAIEPYSP